MPQWVSTTTVGLFLTWDSGLQLKKLVAALPLRPSQTANANEDPGHDQYSVLDLINRLVTAGSVMHTSTAQSSQSESAVDELTLKCAKLRLPLILNPRQPHQGGLLEDGLLVGTTQLNTTNTVSVGHCTVQGPTSTPSHLILQVATLSWSP